MPVLTWGSTGQRYYEAGIDRCVLYVGGLGIAWNGITSINEAASSAAPTPYYLDGVKYLNVMSEDDFGATIAALSAPPEFGPCDGTASIQNGLFITQQKRSSFSFCYRTQIGNDVQGLDYGYKIHLVYNALAAPAARNNASFTDSATANALSWNVTTTPPRIAGFKPSAHLLVDSTKTPHVIMNMLENILYGSISSNARIPAIDELQALFGSYSQIDLPQLQDDGTTIEVLMDYIEYPTPPVLDPGEQALWSDTSSGTPGSPQLMTG